MKERASFTFDKKTVETIDELVNSGKYRNRSHAVEEAIKVLFEKEKAGKQAAEEDNKKGGSKRK